MYEELLNDLVKTELSFELSNDQYIILLAIFSILESDGFQEITLSGSAGTGKTELIKIINKFCIVRNLNCQFAAPTHKAAEILSSKLEVLNSVKTIHQLLNLTTKINIIDFDFKNIIFENVADVIFSKNQIIIIDECSMINDSLYDKLIELAKKFNCKILFVGDIAQLSPVNSKNIAKTFNCENHFQLIDIHRQSKNSALLDTLNILRTKVKSTFNETISNNGSIYCYNSWRKFLSTNINLFKNSILKRDPNNIKLLAYTNKRVSVFNQLIRNMLFGELSPEYMDYEIITAYDTLYDECKNPIIINSCDYIIKSRKYVANYKLNKIIVIGWELYLWDSRFKHLSKVFVLSRNNPSKVFDQLAESLEQCRIDAISNNKSTSTRSKYWRKYFDFNKSFLTPFDLIYNERIVKKKSIDYGYAISVHRSQGSTFNNVLIDMGNINKCYNKEELRQLQYVALSRTQNDVHLLF